MIHFSVIPAKAGAQLPIVQPGGTRASWVPAFTGTTR
jgi:hypothetical protein